MAILSSNAGSSIILLDRLVTGKRFFAEMTSGRTRFLQDLSFIIAARAVEEELAHLQGVIASLSAGSEGAAARDSAAREKRKQWSAAARDGLDVTLESDKKLTSKKK